MPRLSSSPIWTLQKQHYEDQGLGAWSGLKTPLYATSNPTIAHMYATMAKTWAATSKASTDLVIPIFEIGAGAGRFSFYFLEQLYRWHMDKATTPSRDWPFRLILTDISKHVINDWAKHPMMQDFMKAGWIDFAHWDPLSDTAIHTLLHKDRYSPKSPADNAIFFFNYLFDCLPQDAYRLKQGQLQAMAVAQTGYDPNTPDKLTLTYHPETVDWTQLSDAETQLLNHYRSTLSDAWIPMPTAGLNLIQTCRKLAPNKALMLLADKSFCHTEELQQLTTIQPAIHGAGSFSFTVNAHALGWWAEQQGGHVLHPANKTQDFDISALLFTDTDTADLNTCYRGYERGFGPYKMLDTLQQLRNKDTAITLDSTYTLLARSNWDPQVFRRSLDALLPLLNNRTDYDKARIGRALIHVANNYYYLGEQQDLFFDIARCFFAMAEFEQALGLFQASDNLNPNRPECVCNQALCYIFLEQPDQAKKALDTALNLDPDHAASQKWLKKFFT